MGRRKRRQSGICLSEVKSKKHSNYLKKGVFLLFLMRSAVIWILGAAWWNCFFDVFPANIDKVWLYGYVFPFAAFMVLLAVLSWKVKLAGIMAYPFILGLLYWKRPSLVAALLNYLANAYLRVHEEGSEPLLLYNEPALQGWVLGFLIALATVPLLFLWAQILVGNRGKALAAALALIPVIISAAEGYFPSVSACWILIFCMGIYFAGCGSSSGKSAVCSAAASILCLLVLFLLSSAIAKPIESVKTAEGGEYTKVRTALKQNVVQRLREITGSSGEAQGEGSKDNGLNETENHQGSGGSEQEITAENETQPETVPYGVDNGTPEGFLTEGAENLKRIAGFSPGDVEGMIKVSSVRPEGTMYYPIEYGGAYTGYTWEMHPDNVEVYPEYTQYPEDLSRLTALCNKAEIHLLEDASGFIQQEFEENTVYDYRPGVTPDNQDFAEYFLFDNKKGFCVHFATTATLMYRIFGFQARYVQGYAVPASAFAEQEDGTYQAEVTGEMGHAWCETYDGTWTVREHTLPYLGDGPQALAPAANSEPAGNEEKSGSDTGTGKVLLPVVLTVGIIGISICIFLIQGAARRKKRRVEGRSYRHGKGILALYKNLYEIAVFLGMEAKEDVDTEAFHTLKKVLPEISAEEWEWIQTLVWRSMFDRTVPSKEEHAKLDKLVGKLAGEVGRTLPLWRKIEYHYIKCLG